MLSSCMRAFDACALYVAELYEEESVTACLNMMGDGISYEKLCTVYFRSYFRVRRKKGVG